MVNQLPKRSYLLHILHLTGLGRVYVAKAQNAARQCHIPGRIHPTRLTSALRDQHLPVLCPLVSCLLSSPHVRVSSVLGEGRLCLSRSRPAPPAQLRARHIVGASHVTVCESVGASGTCLEGGKAYERQDDLGSGGGEADDAFVEGTPGRQAGRVQAWCQYSGRRRIQGRERWGGHGCQGE